MGGAGDRRVLRESEDWAVTPRTAWRSRSLEQDAEEFTHQAMAREESIHFAGGKLKRRGRSSNG